MTVWLCTDDAWNVNGKIFHVSGGTVSLAHEEQPIRQITKDGKWTVEELQFLAPNQLLAGDPEPGAAAGGIGGAGPAGAGAALTVTTTSANSSACIMSVLPSSKTKSGIAGVVTRKGQVTVPAEIRRELGLKEGDRVIFVLDRGEARLRPGRQRRRAHGRRVQGLWPHPNSGGIEGDSREGYRGGRCGAIRPLGFTCASWTAKSSSAISFRTTPPNLPEPPPT